MILMCQFPVAIDDTLLQYPFLPKTVTCISLFTIIREPEPGE